MARAGGCDGYLRDGVSDYFLRCFRVSYEVLNHQFHAHGFLASFPAVIIGDHRHRGKGDLGFPGASRLAQICHAHDIVAEFVMRDRFRSRAERRSFHVQVSATGMNADSFPSCDARKNRSQFPASRISKGNVGHKSLTEKSVFVRLFCVVHELVDQHDVARSVAGLERTDSADADDPRDIPLLERVDVGSMIQLGRKDSMPSPVSRQENDFPIS